MMKESAKRAGELKACGRAQAAGEKGRRANAQAARHLRVKIGTHLQLVVVILAGWLERVLAVASACRLLGTHAATTPPQMASE